MYKSREKGAAFVCGLLTDFEALAERMEALDAGLNEERRLRGESIEALDAGLNEEHRLRCESIKSVDLSLSQMEQAFTEQSDELATSLAKWTANLSAQSLQCDDTAAQMQAQTEELAGRVTELESTCHSGGAVGELAGQLAACVMGPASSCSRGDSMVDTAWGKDDLSKKLAELEAKLQPLLAACVTGDAGTCSQGLSAAGTAWAQDDLSRRLTELEAKLAIDERILSDSGKPHHDLLRRFAELEAAVALNDKNTLSDFGRLSSSLAAFKEEVKCGRASMATAIGDGPGLSSDGFKCLQERLDSFRGDVMLFQKDVSKMASATDLSRVLGRVESLESNMEARLQFFNDEIGRRVSSIEFQSFQEIFCNLPSQVTLNHNLLKDLQTVVSPLPGNIQTLETTVRSLDRRQDNENERTNSCWVSLESGAKSAKSDLDSLLARVKRVEETSTSSATDSGKFTQSDLDSLVARMKRLEESSTSCATDSIFEALSSQMRSMLAKMEGKLSKRNHDIAAQLQDELDQLKNEVRHADGNKNVCTKDELDQQLNQYYPKQEMDALLARVWWRLSQSQSQSGKVVGLGCLAGKTVLPERPQSARR